MELGTRKLWNISSFVINKNINGKVTNFTAIKAQTLC